MSPCSRIKNQLHTIVSNILNANDTTWRNYLYCNRKLTSSKCNEADWTPLACPPKHIPKGCKNPINILTIGLNELADWSTEWGEVDSTQTPGWEKHVRPGVTLCLMNTILRGFCYTFKKKFTQEDEQAIQAIATQRLPTNATPQLRKRISNYHKGVKSKGDSAVANLIWDLADNICEINLSEQVQQWKKTSD